MSVTGSPPSDLSRALADIVGDRWLKHRRAELIAYESDGLPGYRAVPQLVVLPASRDELCAVVRLLNAHQTPFVPRGAGTGLSGGSLADGTVVIGLNRLTRIHSIDAGNRLAHVEPGVVNATLTRAVKPFGLYYAPDPSSQTACTIGGNVAENAGGPHCLKYGVTLNHIAALTICLPNGELVTLGSPVSETDGYDLLGLFIGSEGCFGIATDIWVRLLPEPAVVYTLLADFSHTIAAAHAVSAIIASGVLPAALEMMDQSTIRAVEASIYAAGYPIDAAAVLLAEVDGFGDAVASDLAVLEECCKQAGARTVRVAHTDEDRARLWQGRKKAFGALGRIAPHLVVQDAVVPRTQLPTILEEIQAIGERHGVNVCNVFHAGDGNVHPNISYDANDAEQAARVHAAMQEIMGACIAAGGTITGEHGVGLDKVGYMPSLFSESSLAAMCAVREVFDPKHRANPGKVIPVHSCREWNGAAREW